MTLLLQLAAVWTVLSLLVAVGCSLLFQGADVGKAPRRAVSPRRDARRRLGADHLAAP